MKFVSTYKAAEKEGQSNSLPLEFGVAGLWPPRQEVVPPDISVDAGIAGVGAEHADALRFAELSAFVVEVLAGGHGLDLGPVLLGAELGGGENDGMEAVIIIRSGQLIVGTLLTEHCLSP